MTAVWRLLRLVPHVLHGLWIVKRRFELLTAVERHQLIQWWYIKTLRILGITLKSDRFGFPKLSRARMGSHPTQLSSATSP